MRESNLTVSSVLLALGLAAAFSLIGCGSSSPKSSAIQPVTTVPGGGYSPLNPKICFQGLAPCVAPAQFELTCRQVGGVLTNQGTARICTLTREYNAGTTVDFTLAYSSYLPIITPSHPQGGIDTGIWLRQGARLTYHATRTGKWGYIQQNESDFWGGRIKFTWFSNSCSSIDWDGYGKDGQLTNEGQPAGLFGSDGTEAFYLGGSASTKTLTIKHDGRLRLGINADPKTPYGCTTRGLPRIGLTTCEDAYGTSYTCG
jgi:hypothetical protein